MEIFDDAIGSEISRAIQISRTIQCPIRMLSRYYFIFVHRMLNKDKMILKKYSGGNWEPECVQARKLVCHLS